MRANGGAARQLDLALAQPRRERRCAEDDAQHAQRRVDDGGQVVAMMREAPLDAGERLRLWQAEEAALAVRRVDGAGVSATVVRQTRGPKIIIFRRKRRKNHRRTQGHRQDLTLLKIVDIAEDAKSLKIAKPAAKAAPKKAAASDAPAKKAAAPKATAAKKAELKAAAAKKPAAKKATPKAAAAKKPAAKKAATKD